MKSVCVYCGSADRVHADYLKAARGMGAVLARRGITLVYGGGKTGLMGALADGARRRRPGVGARAALAR
jgi:predicted Rossmann-fold nucleotide-binding protein